jgi:hypothetical protein
VDWTVYWFMLPVCVAIAGVAMFSGISGAAMLIPVFLIGFPLFDVPPLTTVEAISEWIVTDEEGASSTGVTLPGRDRPAPRNPMLDTTRTELRS